jgi:hypothetical protein
MLDPVLVVATVFFALLMFIGLWMTESGVRSLAGKFDLPAASPLYELLNRISPDAARAFKPAFARITALLWLLLGILILLLAVFGLWQTL